MPAGRRGSGGGGRGRGSEPVRRSGAPRPAGETITGRGPRNELLARIQVAVPAIVVAIVLVVAGGWVFTIGIGVLALCCLHELFDMFDRARPARLAGFAGVIALLVAAHLGDREQVLLVLMAMIPVTFLVAASQARTGGAASISVTMLGLTWIGLAFAHAVLLRDLPHGDAIVIDVLVGTFIGDTGAYLGGRAFGKTRLAPKISPNKTVEGLAIGIVFAVAGVWFAGLYQDWLSGTDALILGVAVAVVAPIGDLFESHLKRDAGTKDTGTLFGAHGGALDRLDAVMFTVVAAFYVWTAIG